MSKKFQAQVKTVKPAEKDRHTPKPKDPTLEEDRSPRPKDSEGESSPLKTPGGTPIIQKTPEG